MNTPNNTAAEAAQQATNVVNSGVLDTSTQFLGSFTAGALKGTSLTLSVLTSLVNVVENTVILGGRKTAQLTKLNTTRFGKAYGKGFQDGLVITEAIKIAGDELSNFDTSSFAAKTVQAGV